MGKKLIAVTVNAYKPLFWGALKFYTFLGLEKSVPDFHGELHPTYLFWWLFLEENMEYCRPASFLCPLCWPVFC